MNESAKSRLHFSPAQWAALQGRVLDIGAGAETVVPSAVSFDLDDGDANHITAFPPESFDCVYSSHCLEHMHDPVASLANWWSLVKPGGHLLLIVPDEDLYEQGCFPSQFNPDHKATFTLGKKRSWSSRSFDVVALCTALPGSRLVSAQLNDVGYDRRVASHAPPSKSGSIVRLRKLYRSARKRGLGRIIGIERWFARTVGFDQTQGAAMAQIEAMVRKG